jgi:hypothetical protein
VRLWRALNNLRWFVRLPLKLAAFLVVIVLVLYPKVWLLPRQLARLDDLNSVLDPGYPGLAPLEQRVREELAKPDHDNVLRVVQQVVYQRIPYAWDWQVWGVVDYLPTVAEVFQKGHEDCDGRAVVAASLLRRMGYQAWLVSDLLHMWVATPEGETMSPTGAEKTVVGTETGTKTIISPRLAKNLERSLSYGVAVFPLARELIILAALCLLTVQPWSSVWRRVSGCLLLCLALELLRSDGQRAALSGTACAVAAVWLGLVAAIAGWAVLAIRVGAPRRRSAAARPE